MAGPAPIRQAIPSGGHYLHDIVGKPFRATVARARVDDIEAMQKHVTVRAPKGDEFGRTEVIYIGVIGQGRQDALDRNAARREVDGRKMDSTGVSQPPTCGP